MQAKKATSWLVAGMQIYSKDATSSKTMQIILQRVAGFLTKLCSVFLLKMAVAMALDTAKIKKTSI